MTWNRHTLILTTLILNTVLMLQGCDQADKELSSGQSSGETLVIEHELGTTRITGQPRKVAVLDMNEADFLDQLNVPIAGMVKDYVPHFLARYKTDKQVADLGAITQPNMERVYALKPDLILMTPLHADHYEELSELAPTLHFDLDYGHNSSNHISDVKHHLLLLGTIFGKEELAQQKVAELERKVNEVQEVTRDRPETALIVMHNNGAFSSFGLKSRYGFVFDALGVKPASPRIESGPHGQPVSSEFIHEADPDILYVIDRTAVMEHRPEMTAEQLANPLLRQTKAWKNGRVVFVDADAWYITAASVTSLNILIDDVIAGYQN